MDTNQSKSPEAKWPKRNGMTVPNGYFEDFTVKMMAKLPEQAVVSEATKRTKWQIIRPYMYLAALFAGAYLMLNIFNIGASLRPTALPSSTESMQNLLADVVNTNTQAYLDEYISINDYGFYDELFNEGFEVPEMY